MNADGNAAIAVIFAIPERMTCQTWVIDSSYHPKTQVICLGPPKFFVPKHVASRTCMQRAREAKAKGNLEHHPCMALVREMVRAMGYFWQALNAHF
jgi:hypothetical protein